MQGTFLEPDMFFYNQGSIFYIFGRMGRRCKKKHRASICDLKSAESAAFFFTGFIQEMFSPVQELGGRASSFHSGDSVFAVQQTG
jgi:hypothetical protein